MSFQFRTISPVERYLLSCMMTECGYEELTECFRDICGHYANMVREDGLARGLPASKNTLDVAQESFQFVLENTRSYGEFPATYTEDESIVIAKLVEIIDMFRPKPFDYHAYLKSPEWKAKRDAKVAEAGGRCQVCNKSKRLECHHRTYERIGNELPDDLCVLCRDCHQTFHDNGRIARHP